MTEISPSLLLDSNAQPANGVTTAKPVYWPGGNLSVTYQGVFAGASAQLVCTTNMPPNGTVPDTPTDWMADDDWIPLGDAYTGQAKSGYMVDYGHVNPCMLAIKISDSANTTRIKALIG
jgi:hypothetical protein